MHYKCSPWLPASQLLSVPKPCILLPVDKVLSGEKREYKESSHNQYAFVSPKWSESYEGKASRFSVYNISGEIGRGCFYNILLCLLFRASAKGIVFQCAICSQDG